jgi:hypothetical protein
MTELLEAANEELVMVKDYVTELQLRLELWKKSEEGTLAQMVETNERFDGVLCKLAELEAENAKLRAAKKVADAAVVYDVAKTNYDVDEAYGTLSGSVVEKMLAAHGEMRTAVREYRAELNRCGGVAEEKEGAWEAPSDNEPNVDLP